MDIQKLTEQLRSLEIKYGFESAFSLLRAAMKHSDLKEDTEFVTDVMQRWHLLYGEEYEAVCKEWGIDFTKYQVE